MSRRDRRAFWFDYDRYMTAPGRSHTPAGKRRVSAVMHLDGIPWHRAPAPRRWHRHWAQSISDQVHRCPCGALRPVGVGRPARVQHRWLPEMPHARRVRPFFTRPERTRTHDQP